MTDGQQRGQSSGEFKGSGTFIGKGHRVSLGLMVEAGGSVGPAGGSWPSVLHIWRSWRSVRLRSGPALARGPSSFALLLVRILFSRADFDATQTLGG
jgi:hypothetical protein